MILIKKILIKKMRVTLTTTLTITSNLTELGTSQPQLVLTFVATCKPVIKKLLLQQASHLYQGVKIDFQERKGNFENRKWNYFSTSRPLIFFIFSKEFKIHFKTGN